MEGSARFGENDDNQQVEDIAKNDSTDDLATLILHFWNYSTDQKV